MSDYQPQPNTFTLFANDKGDNPKRPDYRGELIMPDGTKMRLSAWVRESSKTGKKVLVRAQLSRCRNGSPAARVLHHRMVICLFSVTL
jgi:hypothetical protein